MMLENRLGNRLGKVYPLQDFIADLAMVLNYAELILVYLAGLAENLGWHHHLANVMEESLDMNHHNLPIGKPHPPGDSPGQFHHPPLVTGRVQVRAFHHQRHGVNNPV